MQHPSIELTNDCFVEGRSRTFPRNWDSHREVLSTGVGGAGLVRRSIRDRESGETRWSADPGPNSVQIGVVHGFRRVCFDESNGANERNPINKNRRGHRDAKGQFLNNENVWPLLPRLICGQLNIAGYNARFIVFQTRTELCSRTELFAMVKLTRCAKFTNINSRGSSWPIKLRNGYHILLCELENPDFITEPGTNDSL